MVLILAKRAVGVAHSAVHPPLALDMGQNIPRQDPGSELKYIDTTLLLSTERRVEERYITLVHDVAWYAFLLWPMCSYLILAPN